MKNDLLKEIKTPFRKAPSEKTIAQGAIEQPFRKALAEKTIAQGAIEYLLIIGAAIIIVAIIIILIAGIVQTTPDSSGEVKSGYQGITDIFNRATNTAIITLKLRGNQIENNIEFQSFKGSNTINDLFSSLPNGTIISFQECNSGNPIEKTTPGWSPSEGDCEVPVGANVKIILPENSPDQELEVRTEIEKEPVYLIGDASSFSAINNDPSAHYTVTENITIGENDTIKKFQRVLKTGQGKFILLSDNSALPLIENLINSEIDISIGSAGHYIDMDNQSLIENCTNSKIKIRYFYNTGIDCTKENECIITNNNNCQIN